MGASLDHAEHPIPAVQEALITSKLLEKSERKLVDGKRQHPGLRQIHGGNQPPAKRRLIRRRAVVPYAPDDRAERALRQMLMSTVTMVPRSLAAARALGGQGTPVCWVSRSRGA